MTRGVQDLPYRSQLPLKKSVGISLRSFFNLMSIGNKGSKAAFPRSQEIAGHLIDYCFVWAKAFSVNLGKRKRWA